MKNFISLPVVHPSTFATVFRTEGYWAVVDADGVAVGVMYGGIRTTGDDIEIDLNTGIVTIKSGTTTNYLKPMTQAEYESAEVFGFGTKYNTEFLPKLVSKFPDEITLDKHNTI